jgi:hypothetical protein
MVCRNEVFLRNYKFALIKKKMLYRGAEKLKILTLEVKKSCCEKLHNKKEKHNRKIS